MVALVRAMQSGDVPAEPVLVFSNNPSAPGLGKAESLGVPAKAINHRDYPDRESFDQAMQAELDAHGVELLCLAGFMRILSGAFVRHWEGRMINIHPSLLPKYKGLHTHQRAIDAGDSVAGCSVHLVTATLDDGPILGQREVPIIEGDTAETLAARVLVEEHKLYPEMLRRFILDA